MVRLAAIAYAIVRTGVVMKFLLLGILAATMPWTAAAVCPGHSPSFTATSSGAFYLCPADVDAEANPVTASFYTSCTVTVNWGAGKSAFVTLTSITPGTPMLVSFPAATGAGTGTGFCTNNSAVIGASATSAITFPRVAAPAAPGLSK